MAYLPSTNAAILDQLLPEYQKISQAPSSCWQIPKQPGKDFITNEDDLLAWKAEESRKLYKAVDNDGNVYLIQNPYTWGHWVDPESNGGKVTIRGHRELVYTASQARAATNPRSKKAQGFEV